jgi:hypothetical protein
MYGGSAMSEKVSDVDPWGRPTLLWNCIPTNGSAGFYSSYESIDRTKLYRFSVWVNRTTIGTVGTQYVGMMGGIGSSDDGVEQLNNGDEQDNAYFWYNGPSATFTPEGEWMLAVGHIFPYTTTTGTSPHADSGRYYPTTGVHVSPNGTSWGNMDYRWKSVTTTTRIRCIMAGVSDGVARLSYIYPRIDLVDGTEPSIDDLMSGNFYDPTYENSFNNIGRNGRTVSTKFSEVGPTDEMVGYWPLNGNTLDYSGNENTGTASGATSVEGLAPRDKDCYEFLLSTDKIELQDSINLNAGTEWSLSFWGYKASIGNDGIGGNQTNQTNGRLTFNSPTSITIWTTSGNPAVTVTAFPTNVWFHCVITHTNGNLVTIYKDGVSAGSTSSALGNIVFNRIGDNPDTSGWTSFNGHMFDFRIYNNKLLTLPEINILSSTFDTDAANRTEMQMGKDGLYTFGEFKEDL